MKPQSNPVEPLSVLVEQRAHVLLVTLNRPEARNAINRDMHVRVGSALVDADANPDIRVIIITGAGDQSFCAGADLKALSRGERIAPDDPVQRAWGFAGFVRNRISKPVIAAVNGAAVGGGMEIVLASDLVVAADAAQFALPEVKRGIMAAAGGAFRTLAQLPHKLAMELLLIGDPIAADRALHFGLVNVVVPQASLLDAAFSLANRIAANAPLAVQATKRVALGISGALVEAEEARWDLTRTEVERLVRTDDAREGPRAFAERRTPSWTGQ